MAPAVFLNVMFTATNPGPTTAGDETKTGDKLGFLFLFFNNIDFVFNFLF